MPKVSKEDLARRVNELEIDDSLKVGLMEDIADSYIDESEEISKLQGDLTKMTEDYNDLMNKYKSRFFEIDSKEGIVEEKEEIDEDKIIDIKEI